MKKRVSIVILVLIMSLCAVFATACNDTKDPDPVTPHTHTYAEAWEKDADYHWHASTCEHTDVVGEKAVHTYGDWAVTTAATHTEAGVKTRACTVCGQEQTQALPASANAHTWGEGEVTTAPTCTSKGVKTYTCECGDTKTEAVAKIAHDLTKTDAVAATCTTAGNLEHWTCAECDKMFADAAATEEISSAVASINPENHVGTANVLVAGQNKTHSVKWSCCDAVARASVNCEVSNPNAACDVAKVCACGNEVLAAGEHNYVLKNGGATTATTHTMECTGCDAETTAPHAWDDGEITTNSTCTEEGEKTFTCACGETKTEPVDALNHNFVEVAETAYLKDAATCASKAVYYKSCSRCDEVSDTLTFEYGEFDADNHNGATTTVMANATNDTHDLVCDECDEVVETVPCVAINDYNCDTPNYCECENEVDPAGTHTEIVDTTIPTTETHHSVKCEVCNAALGEKLHVEEYNYTSNEDFEAGVAEGTHARTYTCCGADAADENCSTAATYACGDTMACDFCEQEIGTYVNHVYEEDKTGVAEYIKDEATCTEDATYWMACVCGQSAENNDADAFTTDTDSKLGHDFAEDKTGVAEFIKDAAACGADATYYMACSVCGISAEGFDETKYTTDEGTALTHNFSVVKTGEVAYVKDEASCTTDATYYMACEHCDISAEGLDETKFTTDADSALGHSFTVAKNGEAEFKKSNAACGVDATYYMACERCGISAKGLDEEKFTTHAETALTHNFTVAKTGEAAYIKDEAACGADATYYMACEHCDTSAKDIDETKFTTAEDTALTHKFDTSKVDVAEFLNTAATCTADATYYNACDHCGISSKEHGGASTTKTGSKLGHDFTDAEYGSDATQHWQICTRDNCEEISEKANHDDPLVEFVCETCEYYNLAGHQTAACNEIDTLVADLELSDAGNSELSAVVTNAKTAINALTKDGKTTAELKAAIAEEIAKVTEKKSVVNANYIVTFKSEDGSADYDTKTVVYGTPFSEVAALVTTPTKTPAATSTILRYDFAWSVAADAKITAATTATQVWTKVYKYTVTDYTVDDNAWHNPPSSQSVGYITTADGTVSGVSTSYVLSFNVKVDTANTTEGDPGFGVHIHNTSTDSKIIEILPMENRVRFLDSVGWSNNSAGVANKTSPKPGAFTSAKSAEGFNFTLVRSNNKMLLMGNDVILAVINDQEGVVGWDEGGKTGVTDSLKSIFSSDSKLGLYFTIGSNKTLTTSITNLSYTTDANAAAAYFTFGQVTVAESGAAGTYKVDDTVLSAAAPVQLSFDQHVEKTLTFKATAPEGYSVSEIKLNGAVQQFSMEGTEAHVTFKPVYGTDYGFTVTYIEETKYDITTTFNSNGGAAAIVTVTGEKVVDADTYYTIVEGTNATVTIKAADGTMITGISIGGVVQTVTNAEDGDNVYSITSASADVEIIVDSEVPAALTSVTGAMTTTLDAAAGFNTKVGSNIFFKNANGIVYEGTVTGAGSADISYTINDIPTGTYTVIFQNFKAESVKLVSDTTTKDVSFTSAQAYVNATNNGLISQADGSLTLKKADNTHETAFKGASFKPADEVLTLGYTLTGLDTGGGEAGGYQLLGMFVKSSAGHMFRSVNANAGDQLYLMANDDFSSRVGYQQVNQWDPQNKATGGAYTARADYKLEVEYIISGYDISIRMKHALSKDGAWWYVYGGVGADGVYRAPFNLKAYFSDPKNESNQKDGAGIIHKLSEFKDTLYELDKECQFGISARLDAKATGNQNVKFSNIYYNVQPKAEVAKQAVSGTIAADQGMNATALAEYNAKTGNTIFFKDANNYWHAGTVSGTSFTANLPAGRYTEAVYLNYTATIDLTVANSAVSGQAITFTAADAYDRNGTWKGQQHNADGSVSNVFNNEGNKSQLRGAKFTPSKQILNLKYSIDGMTGGGNVMYSLVGMFITNYNTNGSGAQYLAYNMYNYGGDGRWFVGNGDYEGRTDDGGKLRAATNAANNSATQDYTWHSPNWKVEVDATVDGYKWTVKMRWANAPNNSWFTVLENYDVSTGLLTLTTNGMTGAAYESDRKIYDASSECVFGFYQRRDYDAAATGEKSDQTKNNGRFFNVSYTITDK